MRADEVKRPGCRIAICIKVTKLGKWLERKATFSNTRCFAMLRQVTFPFCTSKAAQPDHN